MNVIRNLMYLNKKFTNEIPEKKEISILTSTGTKKANDLLTGCIMINEIIDKYTEKKLADTISEIENNALLAKCFDEELGLTICEFTWSRDKLLNISVKEEKTRHTQRIVFELTRFDEVPQETVFFPSIEDAVEALFDIIEACCKNEDFDSIVEEMMNDL